jgi:hypothetical protein
LRYDTPAERARLARSLVLGGSHALSCSSRGPGVGYVHEDDIADAQRTAGHVLALTAP